jgi:hypothetical protein
MKTETVVSGNSTSAGKFTETIEKLNRQTDLEARRWFEEKRKVGLPVLFWRMFERFFKAYWIRGGFRNGWNGFVTAVNHSLYQILAYAKYWELREREKGKM